MSYSLAVTGNKRQVTDYITVNHAPPTVKAHLLEAIEPYPDDAQIKVSAYGHRAAGPTDQTNAAIDVRRVEPKVE